MPDLRAGFAGPERNAKVIESVEVETAQRVNAMPPLTIAHWRCEDGFRRSYHHCRPRRTRVRAIYGSVAIRREKCPECLDVAFVLDGVMACCGIQPSGDTKRLRRMSTATGVRTKPGQAEQDEILVRQHGRCFYCAAVFGDYAHCEGRRPRLLSAVWDHVEPFCWQSNNQKWNFVAACSVCNGIKSSRMYDSPEDAIADVWRRRQKKGWSAATEAAPDDPSRARWRALE